MDQRRRATCPDCRPASWVSWVEASRYDAGTAFAAFDRHTFGDMTPWVYRTTDYGKTWTRIVGPDKGVRGYAHVIKEDTVERRLLFLGTELGLWISIDGGAKWARVQGQRLPRASPCATCRSSRATHDLVLATHGRGIWIIDDLTPLRALTHGRSDEVGRVPAGPAACSSGCRRRAGWPDGDAVVRGPEPLAGRDHHVLPAHAPPLRASSSSRCSTTTGKVVDTLPPTTSARHQPRQLDDAAQAAARAARRAARVQRDAGAARPARDATRCASPRATQTTETKLDIGLDQARALSASPIARRSSRRRCRCARSSTT